MLTQNDFRFPSKKINWPNEGSRLNSSGMSISECSTKKKIRKGSGNLQPSSLSNSIKKIRFRLAFTLVELLVVIGIIGILIAMLLPSVQMVPESGRRTVCSNNVRQLALGLMNYESSHGQLPMGLRSFGPGSGKNGVVWPFASLRLRR